jgi:hypothetical protein
VKTTEDLDCELRTTTAEVDYEWISKYELTVGIDTLSGYLNDRRKEAKVMIKVLDENDNAPQFEFPELGTEMKGQRFFAAVSEDAQIGTSIAHIHVSSQDERKMAILLVK